MVGWARSIIVVVIIVHLPLSTKVGRPFVLVCSSIELVSGQNLSNITTRVFIQLLVIAKDYDRDIDGAEDGKLMCLFKQSSLALEKCY
jgi:hypothetical protein